MGMPSINITFATRAANAVARSQKGVVALIVRDDAAAAAGAHTLTAESQVPAALGAENQAYIKRAFMGYVNKPRKVLVYVLSSEDGLAAALAWFATQVFDYLVGPPNVTAAECEVIKVWITERRSDDDAICKAVLPDTAADSEAIVNFTTTGNKVGAVTYTAAQYASRIAGLIAGTPMTISGTFAPLAEVSDVARLTREEMDAAEEAGKLILFHDGEKVKTGRAVNSLQTTTEAKSDLYKKIKLVEAMDMIRSDVRLTIQDSYIGKYANSYDSKCLLVTAIKAYLESLEREGIVQPGSSTVGIDVEAQEAWLKEQGVDTSVLTEQQIKEYATGSLVFLAASCKILDAIEDVNIRFAV